MNSKSTAPSPASKFRALGSLPSVEELQSSTSAAHMNKVSKRPPRLTRAYSGLFLHQKRKKSNYFTFQKAKATDEDSDEEKDVAAEAKLKASESSLNGISYMLKQCWIHITHKMHYPIFFLQIGLILSIGWGAFVLQEMYPRYIDALVLLMFSGVVMTNFTSLKDDFRHLVHDASTPVYACFFTFTGITFDLNALRAAFVAAAIFFVVRLAAIWVACYIGSHLAHLPPKQARIGWMSYITQAGLALGLANKVKVHYPDWGPSFNTAIVALVVLNQIVGPPGLRYCLVALRQNNMAGLLNTPVASHSAAHSNDSLSSATDRRTPSRHAATP